MRKTIHSPEGDMLAALLREARADAGLSQRELAKRIDAVPSLVANVESGERRLDVLELRQYVTALGLTLGEFVERLEKRLKRRKR